ncbi:hypothetical protein [Streptomyces acidiscabies]|uniref:Uncharacterized protein n=1 Tax=Streptomyces acidiscabies TaxID=42234 RepID=A0AAP6BC63_9ACTN|nr:hypothetical protein [Streptomyces acidiscabies]MDX2961928.1 hypothetical protein [Streptomyces acidiscabies]MDX3021812.1 hypothetical protein [Streptomyces acidiscabies]MDX3789469.1 hypothetical protein [Streptomyces acidiscabies]GAQ50453.1 hypothetical protein a10_00230 [Streptomyces acidiscabies]GAV37357.1 hypothetical protein Saa2_00230 [Streptomyces acidiscabies]
MPLFTVVFSNGVPGDPTTAVFPDLDFKLFEIEPGLHTDAATG